MNNVIKISSIFLSMMLIAFSFVIPTQAQEEQPAPTCSPVRCIVPGTHYEGICCVLGGGSSMTCSPCGASEPIDH